MTHAVSAEPALPPLQAPLQGLYRHYKGGWYEVLGIAPCSETLQGMVLYRPLYGGGLEGGALWVRPATMFSETGNFSGRHQRRFALHDPANVSPADLPTARALIAHLRGRAQRGTNLDSALCPPPPEPATCCGRGCHGCVWEGFYAALERWSIGAATHWHCCRIDLFALSRQAAMAAQPTRLRHSGHNLRLPRG